MEAPNNVDAIGSGALSGDRYRTLVSTDIGGTDPDDFLRDFAERMQPCHASQP